MAALEAMCPDRLELLHQQYRRICKSLVDTDEWSEVVMLRVLERYARVHFADPSKAGKVREEGSFCDADS
jgi:AP-3 complex subunit beta